MKDCTPQHSRFFEARRPLVYAHRGGAALGPENTLVAFARGAEAGADGLELDVHLSSDGVVVVHHDETLERTTNGVGPIAARTARELAALDAAWHFAPEKGYPLRGSGVGVPALRDVLEQHPSLRVIIEMKADTPAMGHAVAEEVRRAGAEHRVCLAGFGATALAVARAQLPRVASSAHSLEVRWALYRSWFGWPVRGTPFAGYQVPERASGHRIVSPRFVRHAHRGGLKVQVWTVDEPHDMRRLLGWGVDGLITNRPDLAVSEIGSWIQEPIDFPHELR